MLEWPINYPPFIFIYSKRCYKDFTKVLEIQFLNFFLSLTPGNLKISLCGGTAPTLIGLTARLCLRDLVKQFYLQDPPLLYAPSALLDWPLSFAASSPLLSASVRSFDVIKTNARSIDLHWMWVCQETVHYLSIGKHHLLEECRIR